MKIIDLLNKISNGEEVPKEIVFENKIYKYNTGIDYEYGNGIYLLSNEPICINFLNTEVKVIEDKKIEYKKIEKMPFQFSLDYIYCNLNETAQEELNKTINGIYEKINEIIDNLNSKGE